MGDYKFGTHTSFWCIVQHFECQNVIPTWENAKSLPTSLKIHGRRKKVKSTSWYFILGAMDHLDLATVDMLWPHQIEYSSNTMGLHLNLHYSVTYHLELHNAITIYLCFILTNKGQIGCLDIIEH